MVYFIADTHFYDRKCIQYDNRPFAGVEDMNEALIRNWNGVVQSEDTVYIVGDFSYGVGADIVSTAQRLKGHKILIKGNHDNDVNLKYAFEEIYEYKEVPLSNGTVILSHYPLSSFKDMRRGARCIFTAMCTILLKRRSPTMCIPVCGPCRPEL